VDGTEMPGFRRGLDALSDLTTAVRRGADLPDADFGPYETFCRPILLASRGELGDASTLLDSMPDPPHDLLAEVCWFLIGTASSTVGHRESALRVLAALGPAAHERAAGSGAIDLGPIGPLLDSLSGFTRRG